MRGRVVVVGLLLSVLMVVSAQAGMTVGAKVWVQELSIEALGDEITADGAGVGPTVSIDLSENLWLSGSWIVSVLDFEDDSDMTTQDAEAVLALSFDWIDLGVGFRYSEDEFPDQSKTRKYGPMAYVGLGSSFGDSPVGWYAAASWMFVDLNDDWDAGEHFNAEGGLSLYLDPISATVGYRYKDHYDFDDVDVTYQGVTASASVTF